MKISKRQLKKMNACKGGIKRFIDQTNNTSELVDVADLVGGKNTYDDLLWLAGETISEERIIRFACDCALLNIELIKPYTNDYDLIVEFLKDPSKNTDNAVANAAYDVTVPHAANTTKSAYAAAAVAYAAYATNTAYAVANATVYATHAALDASNSEELVKNLIIGMFNEVNNK